jgi:hypothetical protein
VSAPDPLATALRALLEPIVRQAVADALAELAPSASPPPAALVDTEELCRQLTCSRSMVGRLRDEGLPCVYLGDSPRFVVADVVAWLHARDLAGANASGPRLRSIG